MMRHTAPLNARAIAAELGIDYGRVIQLLWQGQLRGKKVGNDWAVTRQELNRYLTAQTAGVARAVEDFASVGQLADAAREWWRAHMRAAQDEAVAAAKDFLLRHAALAGEAAQGKAPSDATSNAYGDSLRRLAALLARMDHLDGMYQTLLVPLEAEALKLARVATKTARAARTVGADVPLPMSRPASVDA